MSERSGRNRAPVQPEISVLVEDKAWTKAGPVLTANMKRAVRQALSRAGAPPSSRLTILLADDARLQALNKQHRRQDKPSNVLSFPSAMPEYLGDIAIAHGVTAREAKAAGKRFAEHAAHLAVHGTLHLLGYDHVRQRDAEKMEALETEILAEMGIPDPYGRNAA